MKNPSFKLGKNHLQSLNQYDFYPKIHFFFTGIKKKKSKKKLKLFFN